MRSSSSLVSFTCFPCDDRKRGVGLFILLIGSCMIHAVDSMFFMSQIFYCDLRSYPVVALQYNVTTGKYKAIPTPTPAPTSANQKTRRQQATWNTSSSTQPSNTTTMNSSSTQSHNNANWSNNSSYSGHTTTIAPKITREQEQEIIYARVCACASAKAFPKSSFYCGLSTPVCGIIAGQPVPKCYPTQDQHMMITLWPVLIIWFVLGLIFLIFTKTGRQSCVYAISCVVTCCFPCKQFKSRLVSQLEERQQQEEEQHHRPPAQAWRVDTRRIVPVVTNEEDGNNAGTTTTSPSVDVQMVPYSRPVKVLELRTRPYDPTKHLLNDSMMESQRGRSLAAAAAYVSSSSFSMTETENPDAVVCNICLITLQRGVRVGILHGCSHAFHAECLKTWLIRRNVCPLCLTENAATQSTRSTDEAQAILQRQPPDMYMINNP